MATYEKPYHMIPDVKLGIKCNVSINDGAWNEIVKCFSNLADSLHEMQNFDSEHSKDWLIARENDELFFDGWWQTGPDEFVCVRGGDVCDSDNEDLEGVPSYLRNKESNTFELTEFNVSGVDTCTVKSSGTELTGERVGHQLTWSNNTVWQRVVAANYRVVALAELESKIREISELSYAQLFDTASIVFQGESIKGVLDALRASLRIKCELPTFLEDWSHEEGKQWFEDHRPHWSRPTEEFREHCKGWPSVIGGIERISVDVRSQKAFLTAEATFAGFGRITELCPEEFDNFAIASAFRVLSEICGPDPPPRSFLQAV